MLKTNPSGEGTWKFSSRGGLSSDRRAREGNNFQISHYQHICRYPTTFGLLISRHKLFLMPLSIVLTQRVIFLYGACAVFIKYLLFLIIISFYLTLLECACDIVMMTCVCIHTYIFNSYRFNC